MDGVALGPLVNNVGVVGLCVVALILLWRAFTTDAVVSGKRLQKAEERAERWEQTAVKLMTAAKTVVPAMETVDRIVGALPDPAAEREAGAEEAP